MNIKVYEHAESQRIYLENVCRPFFQSCVSTEE
jgi:hypothetical protein